VHVRRRMHCDDRDGIGLCVGPTFRLRLGVLPAIIHWPWPCSALKIFLFTVSSYSLTHLQSRPQQSLRQNHMKLETCSRQSRKYSCLRKHLDRCCVSAVRRLDEKTGLREDQRVPCAKCGSKSRAYAATLTEEFEILEGLRAKGLHAGMSRTKGWFIDSLSRWVPQQTVTTRSRIMNVY
jgi:hypothetical protein